MVDNTDKLEKADMPYVQRITLIPQVRPGVRAGLKGGKDTSTSFSLKICARCWSSYSTSRMGYNECCVGGAILLQIDKKSVRVFKLTKFKLTLCSIAKFKLLVMQYVGDLILGYPRRWN